MGNDTTAAGHLSSDTAPGVEELIMGVLAEIAGVRVEMAELRRLVVTGGAERDEAIERLDCWLEALQDGQDRMFGAWDAAADVMRQERDPGTAAVLPIRAS